MSDEDMFDDPDDPMMEPNLTPSSLNATPTEFSGVVAHGSSTLSGQDTSATVHTCPICGKTQKTRSGATRHRMAHLVNDYESRKPLEDAIRHGLPAMLSSVLEAIKAEPALSDLGKEKIRFCEAFQMETSHLENFLKAIADPLFEVLLVKSRVIPSAQYEQALSNVNTVLANANFYVDVKEKLVKCLRTEDFSDKLLTRMIWRITSKLAEKIQESIFSQMKQNHLNAHSSFSMTDNDVLSFKDHVSYFLRGTYKFGIKTGNSVWKLRCDCLRKRFVDSSEEVKSEDFTKSSLWTPDGITLSPSAFSLFFGLEKIIQRMLDAGTSTTVDEVLKVVAGPENIVLLNEIRSLTVGILPEDASLEFLKDLIQGFSKVSGRLEAIRKQSLAAGNQPTGNVSLRQNLKRNPTKEAEPGQRKGSKKVKKSATPVPATSKPSTSATPVPATSKPSTSATPVRATSKPSTSATPVRATSKPSTSATPVRATSKPSTSATPAPATSKPSTSAKPSQQKKPAKPVTPKPKNTKLVPSPSPVKAKKTVSSPREDSPSCSTRSSSRLRGKKK